MAEKDVKIEIGNRIIEVEKRAILMEVLIAAGVMLRSDCGGRGRCGKCLVRIKDSRSGAVSPPDESERHLLGEARLAAGWRLSCDTLVLDSISLEIPETSLLTPEVVQKGMPVLQSRLDIPAGGPRRITAQGYGIAVDLGTTTIAVYLCNLENRKVMGSTSARNPQAIFGDDVISRISAAQTAVGGLARLQKMVVSVIDWAVLALCCQVGIKPTQISLATVVGNSTMIHLLLGEDPSSIGVSPYLPQFTEEQTRSGAHLGLTFNPDVVLRTLPLISGYLGADLIGAALAVEMPSLPTGTLLVDVGTNGEIILKTEDGFVATSCATGPALEGATIQHGMQATSGAIESVRFFPQAEHLEYTLIQHDLEHPQPPAGICGSGVISTVAELLRAGVIESNGRYKETFKSPFLRQGKNGTLVFEIVSGQASRAGVPIVMVQSDVRAVQLAKGALRTGIDLLCRESNIHQPQKVLLAGAFGSYLHKADIIRTGMLPEMPEEDIVIVGNAAGVGAIIALCDETYFNCAKDIAQKTRVIDLTSCPDFQSMFVSNLSF
jgi:uncharacterized 2Fe-2S/4Fe-4S cluster protein (DUF4445 family)